MFVITGHFKSKVFTSPQGDYHVYWFRANNRLRDNKVIWKGITAPSMMGEYVLTGNWVHSEPYGSQFICKSMKRYEHRERSGNEYLNQLKNMLVA